MFLVFAVNIFFAHKNQYELAHAKTRFCPQKCQPCLYVKGITKRYKL